MVPVEATYVDTSVSYISYRTSLGLPITYLDMYVHK